MQGHPDWRSAVAVTCSFIIILVAVVWTARKTSYKRKESRTNETEESEESENVEKNVNCENDNVNHDNVNDDEKDCNDDTIPELSNPNWVKVGQIQELYMYPLKSGRGKTLRECDFTQYGISLEDKGRFTLRDRMFLVYNEETGRFQTGRQYPTLILISLSAVDETKVKLEAVGMPSVIFEVPNSSENASEAVQCTMWWGEPVKCIDCGTEPAEWLSSRVYLRGAIRARKMLIYSLLVVFLSGSLTVFCNNTNSNAFQNTLSHIRPRISSEEQADAATGVVERLLGPERAKNFVMMVNPNFTSPGKDSFLIKKNSMGQVEILGTSGVAAAWGLHYYLKTYCNVHISWEGNQVELPDILPDVRVKISSNDRFRYYQNVCTLGYTSAWWQWEDWEKNIDWMALNGINLALAFTGQEAIWQKVYLRLNFTVEEINEHFGGPGFLPWSRMGNMRGFGGPLNSNWHEKSIRLQHRILERMRALGIIPVLPAFAGHVPRAFLRLFPKANVTKSAVWNNFSDKYCCPYLLEPTDPLFKQIGQQFLKTYIEEFGTDHVYNCDTFNENEPYTSELKFLRNIGHSIFEAMNNVDSKAIWLMQGWLFYHDSVFWTEPRTRTFLTSIPLGRMIVLDLQSEQFPQYKRLNSYYGQPFIWCMLHNFGGTLGMFGSAEIINHRVFEARNMNGSTMVGTGLTPEGINQNYVIYELMNEMAYRKKPVNLDKWFENYANRRYGDAKGNEHTVTAWKGFKNTVYNFSDTRRIRGKYVITIRPNLNFLPWRWYNKDAFIYYWYVLLQARDLKRNSTLYRHDVVDVTRQALQLIADEIYTDLIESFNKKNIDLFKQNAKLLLALFDDLEEILASSEDFLLGKWLKMAKDLATDDEEETLYEYNARNQITLWGPLGEIRDYANKQWSGIVVDYFKPRWAIFLNELETSLTTGTRVNMTEINKQIFENVENAFTFSRKIYPTKATGDSIDIAERILSEWYDPHLSFHKTFRRNYKQYWLDSY